MLREPLIDYSLYLFAKKKKKIVVYFWTFLIYLLEYYLHFFPNFGQQCYCFEKCNYIKMHLSSRFVKLKLLTHLSDT